MNDITKLKEHLGRLYPGAGTDLTEPLHEDGFWWLYVEHDRKQLSIRWSIDGTFGISSEAGDSFGEGPDELLRSFDEARKRLDLLLATDERTSPPRGVLLRRLREKCGLTQQALAELLGIRQASVSGFERRSDVQVSTLERVLDALGGKLEIFAVFPDGRYRMDAEVTAAVAQTHPADESDAAEAQAAWSGLVVPRGQKTLAGDTLNESRFLVE